MKRFYSADVEGDGLLPELTKLWCAGFHEHKDIAGSCERVWSDTDMEAIAEMFADENNVLIMHNGYSYDKRAVEKTLGITVKAEIIDTLFLSWYLYPKRLRHGLGPWGVDLGIAKPDVEDWDDQEIEVYIDRVEEDVKIQAKLWTQMWKHLKLIYGTDEACLRQARHVSFKAQQAALQETSKWKLDVPRCTELGEMFGARIVECKAALEACMPPVPVMALRKPPAEPYKNNGELSVTGQKWQALTAKLGLPFTHKEPVKVQTGTKPPNGGAHGQVKRWLHSIGWVPETYKFNRNKETNEVNMIEQIKVEETGLLCPSIIRLIEKNPAVQYLDDLSIVTHRKTLTDGFLKAVDERGYVEAQVQGFTNTLRFKHRVCLNLPSLRKPYGAEIRGLLKARNAKTELCGADMSSLEDRTKQHYMWPYDPEYVKDMMADDFDPHLDMAVEAKLMSEAEALEYKKFDRDTAKPEQVAQHSETARIRHSGKSCNYAATYGAQGPTVARAAGVPEAMGVKLVDAYWRRNWSVKAIADACVVKQSRDLKWLWNPVAEMWVYLKAEKDRFSTLNQSTATYCFDRWIYYVLQRRRQLTAQFHDEGVWELKVGHREQMEKILRDAVQDVNDELKLNRDLDIGVEFGRNYGEIH